MTKPAQRIGNYVVRQHLGESLHSKVYLVEDAETRSVLRAIKPKYQSEALVEALRLQIQQLESLHLPNTLVPKLTQLKNGQSCLLRPYLQAFPLSHLITGPLALTQVLEIISEIATRLQECHDAGHIHKAIKPGNILIDSDGHVQLIDDVHVLDINELSHFIYDADYCRRTLPYISPEQTGRIRITVDYTTDLYSLGIIFYELVAGHPPFLSEDPLALIHSHLAQTPPPLPPQGQVPEMVQNIISQLLHKPREKRYQTARGLAHDVERCLREFGQSSTVSTFDLRSEDYSNRITIPSIMVGRSSQKERLLKEFSKVCQGPFGVVFVSGFSGIGKTRLVQELQLPIVAAHGYYASGKFDQYQRHVPYSTLIQALRGLMRVFLTEDSKRLEACRQRLLVALGENGRLVTSIVPELELIIGPQPEVSQLPPVESRNRFRDVTGNFITSLATASHPLTLFIDDLQWCDSATFEIIEMILDNSEEYPHLLLIGAYRHNEVDNNHRLSRILRRLATQDADYLSVHLEALTEEHVNEMTAYILNTWPSKTRALAQVIYKTSDGNPLFVNESIRWLHSFGHLQSGHDGTWHWDDDQVRHSAIPATALELFRDKIERLPEQAKELVLISACLGAHFEAADLAACSEVSLSELYSQISEPLAHNLLRADKGAIFFFHDQVQAAAESLIDPDAHAPMHAKIAQTLIAKIPEGTKLSELDDLFGIVEHLVKGRPEILDTGLREIEAEFNYHAGIRAMNSMAMDNAYHFFAEARSLLSDVSWDEQYERLYSIHKHLARTAMAIGNQSRSEALLDILLQRATSDLDRAECLYEQTAGLSSMGIFPIAIERGNQGLDVFTRRIPEDDETALALSAELMDAMQAKYDDPWQHILDVTPSDDRATRIETSIYSELIPDYYLAGMVPQLYLSAIQSTQNCLAGGVDESVIYGFSMVGLYLQRKDQYELSFRYEDLGMALAQRYENTFGATKGINGILWTNMHNRSDGTHIIEQCWQNIHRGKSCGDLYNAGLSYGPLIWNMVTRGDHLSDVTKVADECVAFSNKFNLSLSLGLARSALFGWCDELNSERVSPSAEEMETYLKKWEAAKHVVSIGGFYSLRGIAQHLRGLHEDANESLQAAQPYLRGLSDNILNRLWYVFSFLNALARGVSVDDEFVEHCLERVETWAKLGPILLPYLDLMRAELAYRQGETREARGYFNDVIETSHEAGYTLLEAFANTRIARLSTETGAPAAQAQELRAAELYQACGATTLSTQSSAEPSEDSRQRGMSQDEAEHLFRASRAISGELDPDKVQRIIMSTVMERAGATDGALLLQEGGELRVAVLGRKREGDVSVEHIDGPHTETAISLAIARFVFRSGEGLCLSDASEDVRFAHDDVIAEHSILSVLCHPIEHQGVRIGVLYLHNSILCGAFELTTVDFVRMLATQGAISMQNAHLYRRLEDSRQKLSKGLHETVARENLLVRAEHLGEVGSWRTSNTDGHIQVSKNLRYILKQRDEVQLSTQADLAQLVIPEDRDAFLNCATGAHEQGSGQTVEIRMLSHTDEPRVFQVTAELSADREFIVGIMHDVTEIRQHQSRLRQAQRMEAIGQLAGGVAHDLNNMLQPILAYSELLLRTTSPGPVYDDLSEILRASKRAADVVRQLLAFSRKRAVSPNAIDLTQIVRDLSKMLRRLIREDVNIIIQAEAEEVFALCDASQLEQIVVNLCVNARDAMAKGGTLTISTGWKRLPDAALDVDLPPGRYGSIRVQDSGQGMSENTCAHIFEPFFTTKDEMHGTGLGLATVYGIVQQHQGAINVRSKLGVGSEFEVLFPEAEAPAPKEEMVETVSGESSGEQIMIVEDDEMVRRTVVRILESSGYSVMQAESAADARHKLQETETEIDLLITDVIMPGDTGVDLYQEISKDHPTLPVVFVSGHPKDALPELDGLLVSFLVKPFTAPELTTCVQSILQDQRRARPR